MVGCTGNTQKWNYTNTKSYVDFMIINVVFIKYTIRKIRINIFLCIFNTDDRQMETNGWDKCYVCFMAFCLPRYQLWDICEQQLRPSPEKSSLNSR